MAARPPLAPSRRRRQAVAGFTLIESVAVLVLLGLVGVRILPKAFNTSEMTLDAQTRTLASSIQRAQLLASTGSTPVYICTSSAAYVVQVGLHDSGAGQACPGTLPSEPQTNEPVVVTLDNSVSLASAPVTPLWFNSLGQPSAAGAYQLQTPNATRSFTVSVAAVTGLVSIARP